jgi:phage terminase large subunit
MTYRAFCDIGGTGAKADAFSMWVTQFVGKEIRALDYYEAVGQPLATHLKWMRDRGYGPKHTQIWLPHDGESNDKVYDVSYASALRAAEYDVTVVPNQGKGAAKARIEAGRRQFPSISFNEPPDVKLTPEGWYEQPTCAAGTAALGWYHEKKDDERNVGLGPEHDWSSHGADAFGLMCVAAEQIFEETGRVPVDPYRHFRRG